MQKLEDEPIAEEQRSRRGEDEEERGEEERRGVTEKGSKCENIWGKRQKTHQIGKNAKNEEERSRRREERREEKERRGVTEKWSKSENASYISRSNYYNKCTLLTTKEAKCKNKEEEGEL